MKGHEAFIGGFKPAYLCSHRYEAETLESLLSLKYPNVLQYELEDFDTPGQMFDKGTLFFQNERMKEQYIKQMEGVKPSSSEEDLILGGVLGYPPVACSFFVASRDDAVLKERRAGFHYYGIRFVGNIDDVEEISEWLWSNVSAPLGGIEVTYQKETRMIEPVVSVST